ncbi:MAG: hypothetical protein SFW66_09970 [Gammaproteobacteria bacterium]|nr:hypothetical protein [Gammaproteobacteria bacterium]
MLKRLIQPAQAARLINQLSVSNTQRFFSQTARGVKNLDQKIQRYLAKNREEGLWDYQRDGLKGVINVYKIRDAFRAGDSKKIDLFLEARKKGYDVWLNGCRENANDMDSYKRFLTTCVERKDFINARKLIELGAEKGPSFIEAVKSKNTEAIDFFIETRKVGKPLNINDPYPYDGEAPLFLSLKNRDFKTAQKLVDAGADLEGYDYCEYYPTDYSGGEGRNDYHVDYLSYFAKQKRKDVVDFLMNARLAEPEAKSTLRHR